MQLKLRHRALLGTVIVNGYALACETIAQPLHARGWGQGVLGYADGLGAMLRFPGLELVSHLTGRVEFTLAMGDRAAIVVANLVFWFVVFAVGLWLLGWHRSRRREEPRGNRAEVTSDEAEPAYQPAAPPPPAASRRSFLTRGVRLAAAGVGATCAYSYLVESRWLDTTRRTFNVRDLHLGLDKLRLVQVTDVHHGPNISLDYVRRIVRRTNELMPDIILLTGDYVYRSPAYIEPVVRELANLRAKIGVIAVLGNHDWWANGPLVQDEFARRRIPLIDNSRVFVTPDRRLVNRSDEGLCIAGVGDYLTDVQHYQQALGQLPREMPRLLLSHNPDVAEDDDFVASKLRVDLMLSGHTHGGQIWVPGFGTPIVPSRYGQKYARGLVQGPACPVYVSRGTGTTVLPMRFCIRPEIAVIELRS